MIEGIPELPEWRIIHTPGHTPGHISLFLPLNTTLIAGDALSTTNTESAIAALSYLKQLSGPAKYITTDWVAAADSVHKLTDLQPRIIAAGHGPVMRGKELQTALQELDLNFEAEAVPETGRYVNNPATADENGVQYIPSAIPNYKAATALALTAAVLVFVITHRLT